MPASQDLNFQNLSTVQNATQPQPPTIASAATIAPITFVTIVSGAAAIVNVTPPINGAHMLVLIPTGAFTMTAAGNLLTVMAAATVGQPVILIFNPITGKYANGKLSSA
jgi:energy-converting hydrogenase Eha subunit C